MGKKLSSRTPRAKAGLSLALAVGALSLFAGGSAAAATTLSAGWNSNCGPQTCFNEHGSYSVTFSASAFNGPVDVSRLFLDRSILGTMGNQFFSVSFGLNGQSIGTWGDWNMGGVAGDDLWLSGEALTWNPADGDLVMVLELVAPNGERLGVSGEGGWYPDSGRRSASPLNDPEATEDEVLTPGDGEFSPPTPPGEPPPGLRGTGPGTLAGPVPEPTTWLLMINGFGLAGAALRRRKLSLAG